MTAIFLYATNTGTMVRRELFRTLRTVDSIVISLMVPVGILFAFVWVFGGAIQSGGGYVNYVMPGLLLMCAAFGSSQTAVSVAQDIKSGVVDRFRTMPIAGSTVLAGHVVASALRNLATSAVLLGCAVVLGFRPQATWGSALAAIALLLGFVLAFTWLSTLAGLLLSPEAASGLTSITIFLPYVSSAFVRPETMPSWLRGFAEHQPFTPVTEALRAFLLGGDAGSAGWIAVAWCVGLGFAGWVGSAMIFRGRRS
ncbi:ABC transporter permease [Paenarthrobacter nitroguajacolicus]|uniref:ABC transporter permease n=1 Tax=Paenarthrobacter nitroguajacolicus TaxID=211146 RepID=UPI000AE9CEC1|nr:ABC transporter permease [Paenarthrobacter nitroguajacolicus]